MDRQKPSGKSFEISKREVWDAYRRVKVNKGAAGVDGCSIEDFEKDLKNNLYKIWNRMCSGSYFPPAVKAVEIPKLHGGGSRILGVPTVGDRVAQTVVARRLEAKVEPIFHQDSYGSGRAGRRWTRWRHAGGGVGSTTGLSIWTFRSSSTALTTIWSSRRCRLTPMPRGWCSTSSGG